MNMSLNLSKLKTFYFVTAHFKLFPTMKESNIIKHKERKKERKKEILLNMQIKNKEQRKNITKREKKSPFSNLSKFLT